MCAASGCKVRAEIGVTVNDNGSGSVAVAVGLDEDATKNFVGSVRTADLQATGWTVTGPTKENDGYTWYRATKPFANPQDAAAIFTEISGAKGPFRDFAVTRNRSFAKTSYSFSGTVDFTGGLEAFGDSGLAAQLDGHPLGDSIDAIKAKVGGSLDDHFQFRVAVVMPGKVSSNAPGQAGNGAIWQPKLSEPGPVHLTATSEEVRWPTIIGVGVAVVAALAIVILGMVFLFRRLRHRTSV